ncbi:MAG: beta-ketoacyl-ACP synthase II [Caldilineales bacterium]|nr:beta-ketoacyl-ACP synthase II [Caldilineales bacterium]MCW5858461.1 beta-ketoacyl-ACP synthase II [Caldilineales bacterium]
MNTTRVVITGLGAVSALGHDVPTIWANVVAGRPNVTPIRRFDVSERRTQFASQVENFETTHGLDEKTFRRLGAYVGYALAATRQAWADAGLSADAIDPRRAGVILGSAIGGINSLFQQYDLMKAEGARRISPFGIASILIDTAPGQIAIDYGLRGPNLGIVGACASGNYGVGEAYHAIVRGDADLVITGGVEDAITLFTISGFERMRALSARNSDPNRASRPFDAERDGFVMADGSAILVIESLEHAQARGAHIYGEVLGYSATADAYHLTAPHENGLGAIEAMERALARAGLQPTDIDYINAHGTSTPLNDATETAAIKRVFGEHAYGIPISSTKSVTGHLLGAAGAFEAMFCLLAMRDGIVPPTINYETPDPACDLDYVPNVARPHRVRYAASNSFGFGGHNSCLILGGPSHEWQRRI